MNFARILFTVPKFFLLILFFSYSTSCNNRSITEKQPTTSTELQTVIAFGSCNHSYDPQDIWEGVLSHNPNYWIWLGDIVYADTEDMQKMKKLYDKQKTFPEYQTMLKNVDGVYGIYDDHDYGMNDGNKTYPKKKESKDVLLEFLDVPMDAEVRRHGGVYQFYELGDERINLILLDTRYFSDPLPKGEGRQRFKPDPTANLLGHEQWTWLEHKLADAQNELFIIGSSSQII